MQRSLCCFYCRINLFTICVDRRSSSSTNVDCARLLSSTSFSAYSWFSCGYIWRSKNQLKFGGGEQSPLHLHSHCISRIHTHTHTNERTNCSNAQSAAEPVVPHISMGENETTVAIHRVWLTDYTTTASSSTNRQRVQKPLRRLSARTHSHTTHRRHQMSNIKHNLVSGEYLFLFVFFLNKLSK